MDRAKVRPPNSIEQLAKPEKEDLLDNQTQVDIIIIKPFEAKPRSECARCASTKQQVAVLAVKELLRPHQSRQTIVCSHVVVQLISAPVELRRRRSS